MERLIPILFLIACPVVSQAARSITLDVSFPYYQERSDESIVEEIRANDFGDIRLISAKPPLVEAFKEANIQTWLLTFMNGAYSTAGLPDGWKNWQMKLSKPAKPDGFTYFCCNNPAYRKWKRDQLVEALSASEYYGVDLVEPYFPGYPDPTADIYGCLCDHCVAAFKKMYPEVKGPPDFSDPKSPRYWKTDKALYERWVGFRVASVVSYLDEIVNGAEGIRDKCPKIKISTWSLAVDIPNQIAKLRESEGLDAAAIVKRVKPDMHVVQTHWPDWMKPGLSAKYPLKYKPVVDSIKEVTPLLPIMLQADIGSRVEMRRSRSWLNDLEKRAREAGFESVTSYEYSIGNYMYTEAPKVVKVEAEPDGLKLVFNKRLDATTASNLSNYSVNTGRVDYAKVDGNTVRLSISGADGEIEVTISGLTDDESRRLYHDKPARKIEDNTRVSLTEELDE